MNKLTKAAIAGGAGIILLMGGAGTFAVWNDSAVAGNATITAGDLKITPSAPSDGAWTSQGGPIDDINDYRIVPGDVLTYTQTFNIKAVGDNLQASVTVTPGEFGPTAPGANTDLATQLARGASVAVTGNGVTDLGGNVFSFSQDSGLVTVSATIVFDEDATTGQNGVVVLSAFEIVLTQTITP